MGPFEQGSHEGFDTSPLKGHWRCSFGVLFRRNIEGTLVHQVGLVANRFRQPGLGPL